MIMRKSSGFTTSEFVGPHCARMDWRIGARSKYLKEHADFVDNVAIRPLSAADEQRQSSHARMHRRAFTRFVHNEQCRARARPHAAAHTGRRIHVFDAGAGDAALQRLSAPPRLSMSSAHVHVHPNSQDLTASFSAHSLAGLRAHTPSFT